MPTVKRNTYVCLRCGHGSNPEDPWVSIKPGDEEPKQCPKCKSYGWKTKARELYDQHCLQCGEDFKSLTEEGPGRCPRCRSLAWDRKVKGKGGRPKKEHKDKDGDSSEEE